MAKSNHRSVDKVERQQRLANARRIQELEQSDVRRSNRLGWYEDDLGWNDDDHDDTYIPNEIPEYEEERTN